MKHEHILDSVNVGEGLVAIKDVLGYMTYYPISYLQACIPHGVNKSG